LVAPRETFVGLVPVSDVRFAFLPAQVDQSLVAQRGEVHQGRIEVFDLNAHVVHSADHGTHLFCLLTQLFASLAQGSRYCQHVSLRAIVLDFFQAAGSSRRGGASSIEAGKQGLELRQQCLRLGQGKDPLDVRFVLVDCPAPSATPACIPWWSFYSRLALGVAMHVSGHRHYLQALFSIAISCVLRGNIADTVR
jgi:hypothetical protein